MGYVILFSLIVAGALFRFKGSEGKVLLIIVLFITWLIIGLRDVSMTPDTQSYADDFRMLSKMVFSKMLEYAFSEGTEPLYIFITWVASLFSNHYSASLLMWGLFPMIGLYKILKDEFSNNKDYSIGIITAWVIGAVIFFMTAVRQAAAVSILLWGFHYFKAIFCFHQPLLHAYQRRQPPVREFCLHYCFFNDYLLTFFNH